MDDATKRCGTCGETKPLERFCRNRCKPDGLNGRCRACCAVHDTPRRRVVSAERKVAGLCQTCGALADRSPARCQRCFDRSKTYPDVGRERRREYEAKYRENNREKRQEQNRRRRQQADFTEYTRVQNNKRRARLNAVFAQKFTAAQLDQRMSMFGHRCWMCAGPFQEVDHVKPLSRGGAHCLANLRPACTRCNRSKRAMWPLSQEVLQRLRSA